MGIAARIDAATPADRDRYLDALRVFSIIMVVLGHWAVRVVTADADGLQTGYLLELAPAWQWATLLVQVMPVFFLVGGMVNAESWRRARAAGRSGAHWLQQRTRRLLYPTFVFLVVVVPIAALVEQLVGVDQMLFSFRVVVFPLWFLATYVLVTALTPATLALHERGGSPLLIGIALIVGLAVDALRFTVFAEGPWLGTQPAIGVVNVLVVWILVHQIGYLWVDGRLPGQASGQWALVLAGGALLVLMIGFGPYPLTMVPIEGTRAPNNGGPPTLALVALALIQLGVAMRLRAPVSRLLRRPRAWAPVALIGSWLMTLYLWHQAVLVAVANVIYPLGWMPLTPTVDGLWWALRIPWLLLCSLVLAAVVATVHRFESAPPHPGPMGSGRFWAWISGMGVVLVGAGLAGLIDSGLVRPGWPLHLPWISLALFVLGLLALGVIGPKASHTPDRG